MVKIPRSVPYLMILPAGLAFAVYVVYPLAYTLFLSFYSWSVVHPVRIFVGTGNYHDLLTDANFFTALRNNGWFILISLVVQLPLALFLAVGVSSILRRHQLLRTFFFAPFVLPVVAVGLIWRLIYEPNLGALNALLESLGASGLVRGWLGDSGIAIFAVIAVSCWRYVGFHMMILLAGLQAIPEDLYEAARIDGASPWQAFCHVTLPMLQRVLLVDALLIAVGSVKVFDIVKVMTDGGPGYASEVLATLMYRTAFTEDRMGYSAAIAVVMLAVTLLFTVVYLRLTAMEDMALPRRVSQWAWRVAGLLASGAVLWLVWGAAGAQAGRFALFLLAGAIAAGLARLLYGLFSALPGKLRRGSVDGFYGLLALLFLLPVAWAVVGSFKSLNDLLLHPWALPSQWQWGNYSAALDGRIGRYLFNSAVVTALSVLLAVAVAAPAAYAFARLRMSGRRLLLGIIISGVLVPVHAALIPLYIFSTKLGVANWPALVGPYVAFGIPLMVLLLRAYFAGMPQELEDAAVIDGAGPMRTLWHIFMPIARPAVATVAIFQAAWVWNELPLALVLVRDAPWRTLPVGLLAFQGEHATEWSVVMAGVVLAIAPVLVLYFLFQRHIVKGLTAGAVK